MSLDIGSLRKASRRQNHPGGFPAEPAQVSQHSLCFWIQECFPSCVPRRRHRERLRAFHIHTAPHPKQPVQGHCQPCNCWELAAEASAALPGTCVGVHQMLLPDQHILGPAELLSLVLVEATSSPGHLTQLEQLRGSAILQTSY